MNSAAKYFKFIFSGAIGLVGFLLTVDQLRGCYYTNPTFDVLNYRSLSPEKISIRVNDKISLTSNELLYLKLNSHILEKRAVRMSNNEWGVDISQEEGFLINKEEGDNELQFSFHNKKYFSEPILVRFIKEKKKEKLLSNKQKNSKLADNAIVKIYKEHVLTEILTGKEFDMKYNVSTFEVVLEKAKETSITELILREK